MNYLKFTGAGVLLLTADDGTDYEIGSGADWLAATEDITKNPNYSPTLISSSSVDFPEEYTDNKELINLCYAIRSN